MSVLLLGSKVLKGFIMQNGITYHTDNPINLAFCKDNDIDFIISHSYRHIISREIVKAYHLKAINLHISYLPFNRGADPNFWSFYSSTPKGVSIHLISDKLDGGDIIVQKKVKMFKHDTLLTSYERLQDHLIALFKNHWHRIRLGRYKANKQQGFGNYHSSEDINRVKFRLSKGWNTEVTTITSLGVLNI